MPFLEQRCIFLDELDRRSVKVEIVKERYSLTQGIQ